MIFTGYLNGIGTFDDGSGIGAEVDLDDGAGRVRFYLPVGEVQKLASSLFSRVTITIEVQPDAAEPTEGA